MKAPKGFLIGEENRGLNAMFLMMNEARLAVAVQGLSQSEIAYQNAVAYAKERRQGRSLSAPKDQTEPEPILVHPDIRRLLLTIRSFRGGPRVAFMDRARKRCGTSLRRTQKLASPPPTISAC